MKTDDPVAAAMPLLHSCVRPVEILHPPAAPRIATSTAAWPYVWGCQCGGGPDYCGAVPWTPLASVSCALRAVGPPGRDLRSRPGGAAGGRAVACGSSLPPPPPRHRPTPRPTRSFAPAHRPQRTDKEKARDAYRHPARDPRVLRDARRHDRGGDGPAAAAGTPPCWRRCCAKRAGSSSSAATRTAIRRARAPRTRRSCRRASSRRPQAFDKVQRDRDEGRTAAQLRRARIGGHGATFRNFHNLVGDPMMDELLTATMQVLKHGGVLGLTDHRAKPGTPDRPKSVGRPGTSLRTTSSRRSSTRASSSPARPR